VQDFTAFNDKAAQPGFLAGVFRIFGVIYITSMKPLALLKKGYRTDEERRAARQGAWEELERKGQPSRFRRLSHT